MKEQNIPYKIYLTEEELPQAWYNLRADMINKPAPLLHPETHEPLTAEDLADVIEIDMCCGADYVVKGLTEKGKALIQD